MISWGRWDESNVFCRSYGNKSYVGMVPRRMWGREQGCRQGQDFLQSVQKLPKGPMAVQGDSRAAWVIIATSSTSCPFNKRLFYIGIFASSFHAIYIPIRLGSSFTCIRAVSRQDGWTAQAYVLPCTLIKIYSSLTEHAGCLAPTSYHFPRSPCSHKGEWVFKSTFF